MLDETVGDNVERKRVAQLNLAGMNFRREKLYVVPAPLPHVESLKVACREHSMEFFHVCSQPCPCQIYVS